MDWVSLGLFAVVVTLVTIRWGTQYAVAFSLAAPLTLFIYNALPWTAFIGPYTSRLVNPPVQAIVVVGILVALFVLINRMMPHAATMGSFPIQAILTGLATAIVVVVVVLQFPALGNYIDLSPLIHTIFGPAYNIFWLIAAYISLAIARQ